MVKAEIEGRGDLISRMRQLASEESPDFEDQVLQYLGSNDPLDPANVLAIAAEARLLTSDIESAAISKAESGDSAVRRVISASYLVRGIREPNPIHSREMVEYLIGLATDVPPGDYSTFAASSLFANKQLLTPADIKKFTQGYDLVLFENSSSSARDHRQHIQELLLTLSEIEDKDSGRQLP